MLNEEFGITEHREYDSFGAIDQVFNSLGGSQSTSLLDTDIGHAGRLWDNDAGYYYNNARWYDASTGRFLGEDPAQDGNNWYAYAGNDPINFRDPSGLTLEANPLNNLFNTNSIFSTPSVSNFNDPLTAARSFDTFSNSLATPGVNNRDSSLQLSAVNPFNNIGPDAVGRRLERAIQAYDQQQSDAFFQDLVGTELRAIDQYHQSVAATRDFDNKLPTRIGGALRVAQAAGEYTLATLTAPTGVGTAASLALGFHATDTLVAGFNELIYGRPSQTYGSQAVQFVTESTGFQQQADGFGFVYDAGPALLAPALTRQQVPAYAVAPQRAVDDLVSPSFTRPNDSGINLAVPTTTGAQPRYWWRGRYSTGASQHGAYQASGGKVFPTLRNSGLRGDALRGAQEAFARIRLLEGKPVSSIVGQAREAGLSVLNQNTKIAQPGANNAVKRAVDWYENLRLNAGQR